MRRTLKLRILTTPIFLSYKKMKPNIISGVIPTRIPEIISKNNPNMKILPILNLSEKNDKYNIEKIKKRGNEKKVNSRNARTIKKKGGAYCIIFINFSMIL